MNKKFNAVKEYLCLLMLTFAFAMLTSFSLAQINLTNINAEESLDATAIVFVKGSEENFGGNIVEGTNYYESNIREAIQSTGTARGYLFLPEGFDTVKTRYQYVVNKSDQFNFPDEYDSNDHESWKVISESGFITVEGFDSGEGNYYIHVRYKLIGSDEIYKATSTNIVVDNTAPGLDATWDPTVPTDTSVTISPILSGIYKFDTADMNISSLESIGYKKGEYDSFEAYVGSAELNTDLTPMTLKETSTFNFEATSNGSFTIYAMDRAGNVSLKVVTINNIYKNLTISYIGNLNQEVNSVSDISFGVTGDELGDIALLQWYLKTDGNEELIKEADDKYLHNTANKVAKYEVRVQVKGSLIGAATLEFEVTPKKVKKENVSWDTVVVSKIYDGTVNVEQSITGFVVNADVLKTLNDVTLTITKTYYESIHASDYINVYAEFEISGADASQFDFAAFDYEGVKRILITDLGKISTRTINVTMSVTDRAYDGSNLVLIDNYDMDNVVATDEPKLSLNIYPSNSKANLGHGMMDTSSAGTNKVVKTYIELVSTDEALYNDYVLNVADLTINITKIAVTITLADVTINYGDPVVYNCTSTNYSSLLVEENKMISGEKLDNIGYDFSQIVIYGGLELPKNVETYDISLEGQIETTNYTFSYVGGKLTILPIELSIILKDSITGKVYDGVDEYINLQNPDNYDFVTLVNGDEAYLSKVIYSNEVVVIKNVGTYEITVSSVEFTDPNLVDNYIVTSELRTYVISRKLVELNVEVEDKYYDGTKNITVNSCYFSGLVDGETLDVACPSNSFVAASKDVAYDENDNIIAQTVEYQLIVGSTATGLIGNYEWVGKEGSVVNSESEDYKVEVTAKINPRPINLEEHEFITKSYDGNAKVNGGTHLLTIDLGNAIVEEINLAWDTNETGYSTINKSNGYEIVVTLSNPVISDYLTFIAKNYELVGNTTLGEITPVKVYVEFKKENGEILTIVYDSQVHMFNSYDYYTYVYENEGVTLQNNESLYVSQVVYEAYKDAALLQPVLNNEIVDINMDASKNVLPYYIKIKNVILSGLEPSNNYEFVFENLGQIIISKQPLQVTFKGHERDYVGTIIENEFDKYDFTIIGLLGTQEHDMTESIESISYTFYSGPECTEEQKINNPINVGTYQVVGIELTPKAGVDLSNYDVTFYKTGTLIINKVALNVRYQSTGEDYFYNGIDKKLVSTDFVFEGLVGEDVSKVSSISVSYSIDGVTSEVATLIDVKRGDDYDIHSGLSTNVLSYLIDVTSVTSDFIGNYELSYDVNAIGSNGFMIKPIQLELFIESINKSYDTTPDISFVEHSASKPRYTGAIIGEEFVIEYLNGKAIDGIGQEMKDAGSYYVKFDLEVNAVSPAKESNYYWIKPANPTVIISPKTLSVSDFVTTHVCVDDENKRCKQYDGSSSIPDDFTITATEESGVFAGEEAIITFDRSGSRFVQVLNKELAAIDAGAAIMVITGIEVTGNSNYIIDVTEETWEYDAIIEKRILDVELFKINDMSIVKPYDGNASFNALDIVVTVESGLQSRESILDTVSVIATASYNNLNVALANELLITITRLSGTHYNNYELSAFTTSRKHEVDGYDVRITPLVISDVDVKVEHVQKVYDAKDSVPTGFRAYAENDLWPEKTLPLVGYSARYESINASANANIIVSNLGCDNLNYVIEIADNTVERNGVITKRLIPLSSLEITPMSKTFDGNQYIDITSIIVNDSYIQTNVAGTKDTVLVISPDFGTFVEFNGSEYVDSSSVGQNKLIRLNDISLDDISKINYSLVDDSNQEALSYIYEGGSIIALDVYIKFNDGGKIYDGMLADLSSKHLYTITVADGYTLPLEIEQLTNLNPTITLEGATITDVLNVGEYKVLPPATGIDVENEENYNFIVTEGTYTITKRTASISLKEGLTSEYNGQIVDLSSIDNWNIEEKNEESNTGFVNSISSVGVDAGMGIIVKDVATYYIHAGTIVGIDENNYTIVRGNAVSYVVTPKVIDVTVTMTSREYDGTTIIDKSLINVELDATDYIGSETLLYDVISGSISLPDASETPYNVGGYVITLLDGTNGGLAKNYAIGTYGNEEIIITPRTILLDKLLLKDYGVLIKTYDGTTNVLETLDIIVAKDVDGGLVIREGNVTYDVVNITYDPESAYYKSPFVGAGNYVSVSGLESDNDNYVLEGTETTFTFNDGSLILKKMLIPQNFNVSPTTKVYDGKVDETENVVVTAVGLVDGDVTLVGVKIVSAILDSRNAGTRTLVVKNISIYDINGDEPRIYNYELDESAEESVFEFIITAKDISANDVDAYFNEELISHSNPLRMPYVPGNNKFDRPALIVLKFKDGVILHEEDLYSFEVTSAEFLNDDGTPAYDVNSRETSYYKVKINFNITINDNYSFDDSITFIEINNSGIIDPMGIVIKAKEFSKIYGESEASHAYKLPTSYTWVYYSGGGAVDSADYDYLTKAIGFSANREITMDTQQVRDEPYSISITWDEARTENYDINVEGVTLKILPKDIKIKAVDTSITYYSDEEATLTYEMLDGTSLVIWDKATALPSSSGVQDVLVNALAAVDAELNPITLPYAYGLYTITKNPLADESNTNYTITVVDGVLSVIDDKESIIENIQVSGWSNVAVTVTFTATDIIEGLIGTPSGVNETNVFYCDAAETRCFTVSFKEGIFAFNVSENGEYIIKVHDKAGNVKKESVSVYTMFTIAPEFEIVSDYEAGHFINEALEITINVSASTTYQFDSKYFSNVCVSVDDDVCTSLGENVFATDLSTTYSATFTYTFSSDVSGIHNISFKLEDAAGNTREKALEVKAIYATTVTSLTVDEDVMIVGFGFNNYQKVEEMVSSYELKYFFSRQYADSKPELEAYNAHGVGFDIINGGSELRSPAGLNGNYRINILLKVKVSDGVYDYLQYQSGSETIKRRSSQPVSLNLSDIVVGNDSGMKASFLSTNGSSVIVSNQKDTIATLSTSVNKFDFVIKYDSFGNELYRLKLVVDGTYNIVEVVESSNLVYLLLTGKVQKINNIPFSGENSAIVLAIDCNGIVDSFEYKLGLNGEIIGIDADGGNVVVIGNIDGKAVVLFTDFVSTWEKVIPNSSYKDVAIDGDTIIVVGNTNEIQFNIDNVIYNGGVVSHGLADGIILSFKLDGDVNFVKRLSSSEVDDINLVDISDGKFIVAGTTTGDRMYYSRFASITTKANGHKNAFIISYNIKGSLDEFSTLDGDGDEEFNSLSSSNGIVVTSVKSTSNVVTPLARSGSPILLNGNGQNGFIITYGDALTIEDVASSPVNYSINTVSLNKETSQLMILSTNDTSYVLQSQRFVVESDIVINRVNSIVSIIANGINVKEIRVMKDGEFVDVNNNQFEVLENGLYSISVIDEYDRVATKTLVVDTFVVAEPTLRAIENTKNSTLYVVAGLAFVIVVGLFAIKRRKEII